MTRVRYVAIGLWKNALRGHYFVIISANILQIYLYASSIVTELRRLRYECCLQSSPEVFTVQVAKMMILGINT